MSQPTGAYSSYDAVGNREDLSDMIWDISPTDTPVLSAIKKGKATNRVHQWQTDALAAASGTNYHIEGDDAAASAPTATTLLNNVCAILKKWSVVTGTQEDGMNPAGRKSEHGYQVARRMKEMKLDLDMSIAGVNNAKVTGNDTTAREMGSLQAWIDTNTSAGSGGSDGATGGTARTDGTQRAFTEDLLTGVLQTCYTSGANPTMLVAGAFNKGKVSGFTGGTTRFNSAEDKKLTASIDVYVGDFHTLKVVPSRQVRTRDVLLIDPDYLKLAEMRGIHSYDLAKTGDSYRKEIVWECTLEVCNEKAHGGVFDLTTS